MASYQTRQRDPLLDQGTQAMLERRGRELMGLGLILAAGFFAALLATYSPDDPGWMVATDTPAQNAMGRLGAAIASTLMIIGGLGSWGIPAILLAWGVRFVTHRGEDRALSRMVFAVIAVACGCVFAATHVPGSGWPHPAIGLGGLFGDTVLGAILTFLPLGIGFGLKLLSALFGAGWLAMFLYVMGFSRDELRGLWRFLLRGLVMTYALILSLAGQGASGTLRAATAMRERQAARREAAAIAREAAPAVEPPPARRPAVVARATTADAAFGAPASLQAAPPPEPAPRPGLLSGLMRRPVAEPPVTAPPALAEDGDDRLRARIADVIRARVRGGPLTAAAPGPTGLIQAAIARREPPVMRATAPPAAMPAARPAPAPAPVAAAPAARTPDPVIEDDADDDDTWDPAAFAAEEPAFTRHPVPGPEMRRVVVQPAATRPATPSRQALAEAQPRLRFDETGVAYELPPLSLLSNPATIQRHALPEEALEENARMLENVLDDYGVKGEIVSVRPGPVVTMYELEPAPGLKASRVIGLADDIARSMSALSARVSTVPGRSVIGIELPNATREKVVLREILSHRDFGDSNLRLPLALGKDIGGDPVVANLAKMPHLLIAGTTGSGKSVAINTMILSLLYKLTPEECRLIMIDPKMLELSVYDGIPHLLSPVVTDPKKAVVALKWTVGEMEERYRKMSRMGVRNIEGYNGRVREALAKGEMFKRTIQTGFDDDTGDPVFETEEFAPVAIPYIVVIVDEMADLMMVAGKEIEACIQRLAQMARASGIHLIMATQRPSVDVITGTIKANFPTRISFQVTSKIDSRTILGEQGAEQLLGMGDMLYMAGGAKITRIHGPFVSDEEVEEIVNHLKSFGPPQYMSGVVEGVDEEKADDIDAVLGLSTDGGDDTLYDQAVAIVAKDRKCSTSYIQRKLGIGYNKAARLVEQMEEQGVVTRANHVGKREILVEER
ncbi:MAG: DNA translocase FtsK 4TM domain-containing protein [Paracoccaceae bacterium]|nr:MAG: DNA translocase FtsK 4TM domain-containing protein [Paracoccaceae bacterium]